ncbi:MAG: hypothetical protein JAY96_16525 [Candidatus Thiodiazotropha endolucinida]|nr:hypothetical protein [Candidatus Thiodiazotropha taylori]MCW4249798.1 hypothetical protein [Candidatus Thiodiazotropha endolucinida]
MAQNGSDQTLSQTEGAPMGNTNFAQRSEQVLKTLENRLEEFRSVAVSVNVMNKAITALRTELDEMKGQNSVTSEQERSSQQSINVEPATKRARTDSMNAESLGNHSGTEDDEDPIDRFLQAADDDESDDDILSSLGQYFNDDMEVGPKLEEGLAKMANEALRGKPQPDKLKKLTEKYKRPGNVENLQVPKVEEILWRQLRKEAKGADFLLQKTQSSFSLALIPIIKAVGILHSSKNKELKPLLELVTDSFKILTHEVTNNHEVRRDKIKKELEPKYRGICNKETSTTKLFGDQLQETIKALGDSKFNLTLHQSSRKSFLGKRGGAKSFPRHSNYGYNNSNTYSQRPSGSRYKNQGQKFRKPRGQNKK